MVTREQNIFLHIIEQSATFGFSAWIFSAFMKNSLLCTNGDKIRATLPTGTLPPQQKALETDGPKMWQTISHQLQLQNILWIALIFLWNSWLGFFILLFLRYSHRGKITSLMHMEIELQISVYGFQKQETEQQKINQSAWQHWSTQYCWNLLIKTS